MAVALGGRGDYGVVWAWPRAPRGRGVGGEAMDAVGIDRLARSMRDLQVIVATLKDKGAHLAATEQPVDTSTSSISRCDTAGSFT